MTNTMIFALTFVATLGSALVAGVFFAFSTFIMKALGRVPPPAGISTMQAINVTVFTPWFMGALFGTGVLSLIMLIQALTSWDRPGAGLRFAGSLVYLVGCIGVTIAFNVPRNDRLAALSPEHPDSGDVWSAYLSSWTAWNHIRTVACFVAAALFAAALAR
jgi:uncharacterized membrane protein